MKITLHVTTPHDLNTFLARAAAGLRSVNDDGEAVIAALEAAVPGPHVCGVLSPVVAAATLAAHGGNVTAAARALGVERSTVRTAARKVCRGCNARPMLPGGYCGECEGGAAADLEVVSRESEWKPR